MALLGVSSLGHCTVSQVRGTCVHIVGQPTWGLACWGWDHGAITLAGVMGMWLLGQPESVSARESLWNFLRPSTWLHSFSASLDACLLRLAHGMFLRPGMRMHSCSVNLGAYL